MSRIPSGLLCCSLAAICLCTASAVVLPPMPADGIRDDARAMSAEAHKALADEIKTFTARTGIVVVVDTNTFLEQGQSTSERCRALSDEWIGRRPGVVFCLNRGVKPVPFVVFSQELFERYPEPDISQAAGETTEAMAKVGAPENRLPVGVRVMMGRLSAMEKARNRREAPFHRRELEMIAGFAGFLTIGGFITWLIVRRRGRLEAIDSVKHHFPDVEVASRLGAPSGGGVVAEVSYVKTKV